MPASWLDLCRPLGWTCASLLVGPEVGVDARLDLAQVVHQTGDVLGARLGAWGVLAIPRFSSETH